MKQSSGPRDCNALYEHLPYLYGASQMAAGALQTRGPAFYDTMIEGSRITL